MRLAELRALGFAVTTDGKTLLIEPASRLTDALRDEIRASKLQLLHELAAESRSRPQFPAWTRPRYSDRPRRRAHRHWP